MARIIYQPLPDAQKRVINENTQKLMAYLYLNGPANIEELIESLSFEKKSEVLKAIDGDLSKESPELISMKETGQQTIQGDQVQKITLTAHGEQFVDQFHSEIAVPLSVQAVTCRMERIHDEMAECLHQFESQFFESERDEERQPELEEVMERLEEHFDIIRENTFDNS